MTITLVKLIVLWVAAYTAEAYKYYMGGCFIYTKKIKLVSKIKQYLKPEEDYPLRIELLCFHEMHLNAIKIQKIYELCSVVLLFHKNRLKAICLSYF